MTKTHISLVVPCFNGGAEALATVIAIGRLPRPADHTLEAVVVDDASTDGSTAHLARELPDWARLLRAPANLGRAGAINLGVTEATGSLLLLLDCDCTPAHPDFLQAHLACLAEGADASIGDIVGHAGGFWGRYQSAAGRRRAAAAHDGGMLHSMTTANILLRAPLFRAVGGFDPRYRHYGFEDRDLLLRMQRTGARLAHNANAPVDHAANLDFPGISRKMQASGRYSAPLFRGDHPEAYRALGYAAIDATLHPWRAALLAPLARLAVARADSIEAVLDQAWLPYPLRKGLARAATALAYLHGTRQ
ncbi:glycosyltransferase family 2 protein [Cognatiluteimonas weifangensis]|uniref:Glycosyltransferase family 2 protein n=1 Tax=Cognatiluteimonas weifangensis TaxID=2303539 RepID=A0A372DSL6_9GAMM|nr:glycosyltransferase [Luteimonas weifangensis]RFP62539.1 glycosyltransferase family 2 protein [Luteimonas weifangensis]